MARRINKLSSRLVATACEKGLYGDGGGLYLQVGPTGSKAWLFRFMLAGKAREMGLGSIHTVSLSDARMQAERCRRSLQNGIDPIEQREQERTAARVEAAKTMTFRQCAEAYIEAHKPGWKNAKHAAQWGATLTAHAYPVLGNLPVQAVDIGLITKVLEPIWYEKTETASRLRGRIESVLDWATVRDYRNGENPARWKGHLENILPARSKVQKVEHHPALPYDQMAGFMAALRAEAGTSAKGLEFQILTAARTGEVIGARWEEIDLEKGIWTVPAERMKAGNEHRVPLSAAASAVLAGMEKARVSEFVFPGARPKKPLSNMAFLQLLKRMKRADLTAHGFRSSFRDWAAERTNFPREVAEMALGHTIGDKVEAAYRRGDLFEKRHKLMEAWANHCAMPASGQVVPLAVSA